jgi:hypothetical protein
VGSLDSQGTVEPVRRCGVGLQLARADAVRPAGEAGHRGAGRKIVSLYVPGSTFAQKYPDHLVGGNGNKGLSLT